MPIKHLVAQVPPQSMAVSVPFLMPSLHDPEGATQTPPVQVPLVQSVPARQVLPLAQSAAQLPPQSMSVSVPFFTPSVQVGAGAAQTPAEQLVLEQSAPTLQVLPLAHLAAQLPPQSISLSLPFLIPSAQVGSAVQIPVTQLVLVQSVPARQVLPLAQSAAQLPPQSTSVSVPFFTPSVQVGAGAAQTPAEQLVLEQSALTPQVLPLAHLAAHVPPQSTSLSLPFLIPSVQVGSAVQIPATQLVLVQSVPARQVLPLAQSAAQLPPQSTSVSVPFFTPSVQVGAGGAQRPAEQLVLEQSALTPQVLPLAHLAAQLPPQSTSLSLPFLMPSLQVGSAVQIPAMQLVLVQSPPTEQVLPLAQSATQLPPQSTSVSVPFFTPSVQVGAGGAQRPAEQLVLEQSALTPQVLPLAHLAAQLPPQSTSLSLPFLIPSLQVGSAVQSPATQLVLVQSVPARHDLPLAQSAAQLPPQSMSVSVPFLMPSEHETTAPPQTPAVQIPLVQSLPARQVLPLAQRATQLVPPQSMADSVPFLMPSLHFQPAGMHMFA